MSTNADRGEIVQKVMICGKLPTANEYIDACRKNRYAAAKMKRDAEMLIIQQIKRMQVINERIALRFTWCEKTRKRDPDNVAFAKKFVLDALQKSGKLKNDNATYIAGFEDRFVYGQYQGVLMEIKECENGEKL